MPQDETELRGNVVKVDRDRRIAYGWAYVVKRADGTQVVDHSGDVIDTDEAVGKLRDAFDRYARDHRSGDVDHETFEVSKLVEYVWMDAEKAKAMGIDAPVPTAAWVGQYFPPDDGGPSDRAWRKVRRNGRAAFSIVGGGRREDE